MTLGATCSGCGDCCAPVVMNRGLDDLPDDGPSTPFVQEHWHEISFAEASEMKSGLIDAVRARFFRCDVFDSERRTCGDYDNRPPVCVDFPWYGKRPEPVRLQDVERCSYWADVAVEDQPVHFRAKASV